MSHRGAVVITGASTGIGEACALYLDQRGFHVFAGVRKSADGEALQQKASARLKPILIDVTQSETITTAAEAVTKAVGGVGVTGLVNNAGIAIGGPLEFLPIAELRRQLEVNVIGQVAVTQAFLPLLRAGRGRVINMSSISGRIAMPFFGPYASSKFALEALTDSLRLELLPWGIKVISIQPGAITTPIWEKSLAKANEISDKLPAEAHRLYGPRLTAVRQSARQSGEQGIPAEAVAEAVLHALTAKRPKLRYLVGQDAKAGALLVKLLPERLREWLVVRSSKRHGVI